MSPCPHDFDLLTPRCLGSQLVAAHRHDTGSVGGATERQLELSERRRQLLVQQRVHLALLERFYGATPLPTAYPVLPYHAHALWRGAGMPEAPPDSHSMGSLQKHADAADITEIYVSGFFGP